MKNPPFNSLVWGLLRLASITSTLGSGRFIQWCWRSLAPICRTRDILYCLGQVPIHPLIMTVL